MLRAIQQFFESNVSAEDSSGGSEERVRLATAALFVEMTRADFEVTAAEDRSVLESIQSTLAIGPQQAEELLELAKAEASEAVELFQFTRLVDREFSNERKAQIVQSLWEVALADSYLDRHEEGMVRKIADLLHVPHSEFIAAKKRARARFENAR